LIHFEFYKRANRKQSVFTVRNSERTLQRKLALFGIWIKIRPKYCPVSCKTYEGLLTIAVFRAFKAGFLTWCPWMWFAFRITKCKTINRSLRTLQRRKTETKLCAEMPIRQATRNVLA